jgi:RHS repeat-associated protein
LGCLRLPYQPVLKVLEQNSFLVKSAVEKKDHEVKKRLSSFTFAFNGKEQDNEVSGSGNTIAFEARIYDSRLGRFFSTDPWEYKYAWQTPYAYFKNSPIITLDFLGKGDKKGWLKKVIDGKTTNEDAEPTSLKAVVVKTKGLNGFQKWKRKTNRKLKDAYAKTKSNMGEDKIVAKVDFRVNIGLQMSLEWRKFLGATVNLGSMELFHIKGDFTFDKDGLSINKDLDIAGGTDPDDYIQFESQISGSTPLVSGGASFESKLASDGGDNGGVGYKDTKVNVSSGISIVSATDTYDLTNDQSEIHKTQTVDVGTGIDASFILGFDLNGGIQHIKDVKKESK